MESCTPLKVLPSCHLVIVILTLSLHRRSMKSIALLAVKQNCSYFSKLLLRFTVPATEESQSEAFEATMAAIDKINEGGGLLPQMWGGPFLLQPIVRDCRSNVSLCAEEAYRLLHDEQCVALFGTLKPAARRAVSAVSI